MPKRKLAQSAAAAVHPDTAPTAVTLGTDFSGLDGVCFALQRLGVRFEHVFSAETDKAARKFIRHAHQPRLLEADVRSRDYDTEGKAPPTVKLYVAGPPCQPFSSAGKRRGFSDDRGMLLWSSVDYIVSRRPVAVLLEQTDRLQQEEGLDVICRILTAAGYSWKWMVLNTMDYGVPQSRRRIYLQAVLSAELRQPLTFPPPLCQKDIPPLSTFLTKSSPPPVAVLPEHQAHARRVQSEMEKHAQRGLNPFVTGLCIDCGSSDKWVGSAVEHAMTLTKSRCQDFGHWLTSQGRYLDLDDYSKLQGYDPDMLDFPGAGVKPTQGAAMLGNAMSLNILEFVLPELLHSAGLISSSEYETARTRAKRRWT